MKQTIKMIYLASPYTDPDVNIQEQRYEEVTKVAAELTQEFGHAFILPITQSHQMVKHIPELGGSFANWKDIDLLFLSRCDEMWVVNMPGWDTSTGVTAEIRFAKEQNIPVMLLSRKEQ